LMSMIGRYNFRFGVGLAGVRSFFLYIDILRNSFKKLSLIVLFPLSIQLLGCGDGKQDNTVEQEINELKQWVERVSSEVQDLRSDVQDVRSEVDDELKQWVEQVSSEVQDLRSKIDVEVQKMLNGTVYVLTKLIISDDEWTDYLYLFGSGVVYKGKIITNRHVVEPYRILEEYNSYNKVYFYSLPSDKCDTGANCLSWLRTLRECYYNETCYKARTIFNTCRLLYYYNEDPNALPCPKLFKKIGYDYYYGYNAECVNDFFFIYGEFENMNCYSYYSAYLPSVRTEIKVYTFSGDELKGNIEKLPSCKALDLAILSVNQDVSEYNVQVSKGYSLGDRVFAVGQPENLSWTLTTGVVSAKRKYKDLFRISLPDYLYDIFEPDCDFRIIQTDAAINPGNSGGGLFLVSGALIGINTFKVSGQGTENLGFAIDVSELENLLK